MKKAYLCFVDEEVTAVLLPWQTEIEEIANRPVGSSRVYLQQEECARGECNLGNLYTDAMLHAFIASSNYDAPNWSNITLALTTQGNFRVPIPAGNITYKQLVAMCPWENRLFALTLRGLYIWNLLEDSVASMNASLKAPASKSFLQLAGMRVRYNISALAGKRIADVKVRCSQCDVPSYLPLDLNKDYRLVVMEYLANGKNGFGLINKYAKDIIMGPLDLDALISYMLENEPIVTGLEGRIEISR